MSSLILKQATSYLQPILLLFSVFLLLEGHNAPGGGFAGGLVAAASFVLYAFAFGTRRALRALYVRPHTLVGIGLLVAVGTAVLSLLMGEPFMTGQWVDITLPVLDHIYVGTPQIFDAGVYLVVVGVTLMIILTLAEEERPSPVRSETKEAPEVRAWNSTSQ